MLVSQEQKIGRLWLNPACRPVLKRHVPELTETPHLSFIYKNMALADYAAGTYKESSWLDGILGELAALPDEAAQNGIAGAAGGYGKAGKTGEAGETGKTAAYDDPGEAASAKAAKPDRAEKWGVFELELAGPQAGNPFVDVELTAEFAFSGGGEGGPQRSVNVSGFYDGDGVYRIRFMPDAEGEWRYRTFSNARSLSGLEGRFVCTAPSAGNHGPVRGEKHVPFRLRRRNGLPPDRHDVLRLDAPGRRVGSADA